jgi:hypothetical protein
MTDEQETPLTPEQDQEVRRLLGEARHTDPMPPDVVARLDRVLDDLSDEPSRRAPVVHLARRRRRVASLLVAAAAVVVVGIGIGQVVGTVGSSDGDADTAGSAAEDQGDRNLSEAGGGDNAAPERDPGSDTLGDQDFVSGKLFKLRPEELSMDLVKVQAYADASNSLAAAPKDNPTRVYRKVSRACRSGDWGTGTFVPVKYGSQQGVVVFRRPLGDVQVAEVYLCGNPDPVRSLTLPAP